MAGVDGAGSSAGQLDVCGHHGCGAFVDAAPEWHEFQLLQPRSVERDDGQSEVAVDVGIAVSREVLDGRDHAAVARAGNVRGDQRGNPRGVLAVRSRVDHRVARVVVDVRDRREVHLHAERARFDRRDPRFFTHQPHGVALGRDRAHPHLPRERRRTEDAEADARLEVRRVE